MIISDSSVSMAASHALLEESKTEENLRAWIGNERPDFESAENGTGEQAIIVQLSEQGTALSKDLISEPSAPESTKKSIELEPELKDKMKLVLIIAIVEAFTGKKITIKDVANISDNDVETLDNLKDPNSPAPSQEGAREGWGIEYDYHEIRYEKETVDFNASGTVRTADGKEIDFKLTLNMDREYYSEKSISIRAGDAKKVDPLVINFNGTAADLSNVKFSFDLDSNGSEETIPFLAPGSGFLALDLNNDNIVNNGSELFGPSSGDGFSELASYDEDGNNWIDENDDAYEKLRIWLGRSDGQDTLVSLKESGVGAIYLGNVLTPFALKTDGVQEGEVATTGIYLTEVGSAGSVQQIDFFV